MTLDISILKDGVNLAVSNGGKLHYFKDRGIKALLDAVRSGSEILRGAEVADTTVGKAAAMLLIKGGALAVHAGVMSVAAKDALAAHGIKYDYVTLVERILNRAGTGLCPMEHAVLDINDPDLAFSALENAIKK